MINYLYDAYTILNKVYSEKAYLKQAIKDTFIEEKNRSLTIKTVYGVLDKDIELSYYLKRLTEKSPKLVIRTVLKISMYAIKYLEKKGIDDNDIILIHDAARPLISQTIISDNIIACKKYHAVDTVIPSSDTIIRSIDQETIYEIQKRSEQYQGQTPQSFTFKVINDAHNYAKETNNTETTDDCRLVLNMGHDIHIVKGSKLNFKITTFDDLMMLKALLKIGKTEVL